jgi:ethanolamine utilization protein EutN
VILGTVVGQVVCTQKDPSLLGKKILVVQPLRLDEMKSSGQPIVALDSIGAGEGEVVMVVGGSSARFASDFSKTTVDQSIVAIVDSVEIRGSLVFKKGQ